MKRTAGARLRPHGATHDNVCYVKSQETELLPPERRLPSSTETGAAADASCVGPRLDVTRNFADGALRACARNAQVVHRKHAGLWKMLKTELFANCGRLVSTCLARRC